MAFILSAGILAYMSGPMLESRKSGYECGGRAGGGLADSHGEGHLQLIPKPSTGAHDDATSSGRATPSAPAATSASASASSLGGSGAESRIRAAGFPAPKALEDFDHDYPRSLDREAVAMLGKLHFITAKENVVLLGPPGTGKTHLAVAFGTRACRSRPPGTVRHRCRMGRPTCRRQGRRPPHRGTGPAGPIPPTDRRRTGLLPLQAEEAQLIFRLVAHRYERGSLIVTSDKPLSSWDLVLSDTAVASAVIDRLVHHSEIISVEGDNYRMRDHGGFGFTSPAVR